MVHAGTILRKRIAHTEVQYARYLLSIVFHSLIFFIAYKQRLKPPLFFYVER